MTLTPILRVNPHTDRVTREGGALVATVRRQGGPQLKVALEDGLQLALGDLRAPADAVMQDLRTWNGGEPVTLTTFYLLTARFEETQGVADDRDV